MVLRGREAVGQRSLLILSSPLDDNLFCFVSNPASVCLVVKNSLISDETMVQMVKSNKRSNIGKKQ